MCRVSAEAGFEGEGNRLCQGLNNKASKTSLTSPVILGCVCIWTDENIRPKRKEFVTPQ